LSRLFGRKRGSQIPLRKRRQFFIGTHNETLSVGVSNPNRSSVAIQPETQPQFQQALGIVDRVPAEQGNLKPQKCLDLFDPFVVQGFYHRNSLGEKETHFSIRVLESARLNRAPSLRSRNLFDGDWNTAGFLPSRSANEGFQQNADV
jgi:hypothetical protein